MQPSKYCQREFDKKLQYLLPVLLCSRGIYITRQAGKKCTELFFELFSIEFVVRMFQVIVGHEICASCGITLFCKNDKGKCTKVIL